MKLFFVQIINLAILDFAKNCRIQVDEYEVSKLPVRKYLRAGHELYPEQVFHYKLRLDPILYLSPLIHAKFIFFCS